MNKKEIRAKIRHNWYKFHVPGCSNLHRIKRNAVFISPANSLAHEIAKLKVCYELRKTGCDFITEAVENKTGLRRDVVDLTSGIIFEIETDKKRASRFLLDPRVRVIKLWENKNGKNSKADV